MPGWVRFLGRITIGRSRTDLPKEEKERDFFYDALGFVTVLVILAQAVGLIVTNPDVGGHLLAFANIDALDEHSLSTGLVDMFALAVPLLITPVAVRGFYGLYASLGARWYLLIWATVTAAHLGAVLYPGGSEASPSTRSAMFGLMAAGAILLCPRLDTTP